MVLLITEELAKMDGKNIVLPLQILLGAAAPRAPPPNPGPLGSTSTTTWSKQTEPNQSPKHGEIPEPF